MILSPDDMVLRKRWITDLFPEQIASSFPGLLEAVEPFKGFSYTPETRLTVVGFIAHQGIEYIEIKTPKEALYLELDQDMGEELGGQQCLQSKDGRFDLWGLLSSFDWPWMPLLEFVHLVVHLILKHLVCTAIPKTDAHYSKQPEFYKLSEFVWTPPNQTEEVFVIFDKSLRFEVLTPALWLTHIHLINLFRGMQPARNLRTVLREQQSNDQLLRKHYHL